MPWPSKVELSSIFRQTTKTTYQTRIWKDWATETDSFNWKLIHSKGLGPVFTDRSHRKHSYTSVPNKSNRTDKNDPVWPWSGSISFERISFCGPLRLSQFQRNRVVQVITTGSIRISHVQTNRTGPNRSGILRVDGFEWIIFI